MKTAISISDDVFAEVDKLAQDLKISRSQVFSEAVEEYLRRRRAQNLLQALNRAYQEEDTGEERLLKKQAKRYRRRLQRKEKW